MNIKTLILALILIFLITVGILIYKGYEWPYFSMKPKYWTLFIYSTSSPDRDYLMQRIDGYDRQTDCIEKGFTLSKDKGSYECGYNCRFRSDVGMEVCEKFCNGKYCLCNGEYCQ